jgi:hypothetical protein
MQWRNTASSIALLRHTCARAACLQHSACRGVIPCNTGRCPLCACTPLVPHADQSSTVTQTWRLRIVIRLWSGSSLCRAAKERSYLWKFKCAKIQLSQIPSCSVSFVCLLYIHLPYISLALSTFMSLFDWSSSQHCCCLREKRAFVGTEALWRRYRTEIVISWHSVSACCNKP